MNSSDFFLFSSGNTLPDEFFRGYAFFGPHFVLGEQGLRDLQTTTGMKPEMDEDGHYVLLRKQGNQHILGTDYKGLMKIFVYQEGTNWAVSNSFAMLVRYVRRHRWKLTARKEHLKAWLQKTSLWQQLWSFDTAAEQIKLLPSFETIVFEGGDISFRKRQEQNTFANYRDALQNYLSIWVSRAHTLLSGTLSLEISGGVDSRASFALFKHALDRGAQTGELSFISGERPSQQEDFRIAQELASHYDFSLNKKIGSPQRIRSPQEAAAIWELTSLGSYAPFYLPRQIADPNLITVNGGGGESFRAAYEKNDAETQLSIYKKLFSKREFNKISQSFMNSIQCLDPNVPQMIAHYREFRGRIHSGLLGNYTIKISPLASKYLYHVAAFMNADQLKENQLLFDIMHTLVPSLLDQPFDNPKKKPSATALENLVKNIEISTNPGKLFSGHRASIIEPNKKNTPEPSAYQLIATSLSKKAAKQIMQDVINKGGFTHPTDANIIHSDLLERLLLK